MKRLGAGAPDDPDAPYLVIVQMFTTATGIVPGQPGWWEQVPYRPLVAAGQPA